MTKQTRTKLALALAVTLMLSNTTHVFAQHGGGEPNPTGEPGNGVTLAQHGGGEPNPTGEPGNGLALHYTM